MTHTELLEKFFAAENARDWDAYQECLHPDVMWFMHGETFHTPVVGREAYIETIKDGYKGKDGSFTCENAEVSRSGNRIAARLRSSTGERVLCVFDFEEGLIRWEYEFLLDS